MPLVVATSAPLKTTTRRGALGGSAALVAASVPLSSQARVGRSRSGSGTSGATVYSTTESVEPMIDPAFQEQYTAASLMRSQKALDSLGLPKAQRSALTPYEGGDPPILLERLKDQHAAFTSSKSVAAVDKAKYGDIISLTRLELGTLRHDLSKLADASADKDTSQRVKAELVSELEQLDQAAFKQDRDAVATEFGHAKTAFDTALQHFEANVA